MTLSITTLCIMLIVAISNVTFIVLLTVMLSVVILNVAFYCFIYCHAEWHNAEPHCSERLFAECRCAVIYMIG
jgi:hypothetical protein